MFAMSTVLVGTIISLKSTFSLLGSSQLGRLSNYFNPIFLEAITFLTSGISLLLIGLVPNFYVFTIGTIFYGISDGILNTVQKSIVNALANKESRGAAISVSTGIGNLGKASAPILMALILSWLNVEGIFIISGCMMIIAFFASFISFHKFQEHSS